MDWTTHRNRNDPLFAPLRSGSFLVVPILPQEAEVEGYAVIDMAELSPQYRTQDEAKRAAEALMKKKKSNPIR
jgi:hypothetical protein